MIADYICGHCGRKWGQEVRRGFVPKYCGKACRYNAARKTAEQKLATKNACKKKWTEANRDRVREAAKAWRRANPDLVTAAKKRDAIKNAEAIRERKLKWYEANKEHVKRRQSDYSKKNAEEIRERAKAWTLANPERVKERTAKYWRESRWSAMLGRVRKVNKEMGLPCDLTSDWLRARFEAGVCEMSGMSFDMSSKRGPNSPSIDRIIPGAPYSQANCRLVLWSINHALSNYGEDYVLGIFAAILERKRVRIAA